MKRLALLILLVGAHAASAQTIRGSLMEFGSDAPIDLGLIIMISEFGDSVAWTLSSSNGFFEVAAPEGGNYLLLAAALGYKESRVGLFELGEGGEISVEFRLWEEPLMLDGIMVESLVREPELVRNGFYRRMQRGSGSFIRPSDIEETTALRAAEMLQGLAGVRMVADSNGLERVQLRGARGYCVPTLFVDGVRTEWGRLSVGLDEIAPLETLYAIELYRGVASIPIEFGSFNDCGVIAFWTKRTNERR
ncbi:MAG: TonB-dependent receptor [Longimicrobiales bacterium]|nr:TonB-dependent receptor [Longimicrobiales bacterium]